MTVEENNKTKGYIWFCLTLMMNLRRARGADELSVALLETHFLEGGILASASYWHN